MRISGLSRVAFIGLWIAASASASDDMRPIDEVFEPKESFDHSSYGKVAVVQWVGPVSPVGISEAVAEDVKQRNRQSLERYIREAAGKGAEWVVTPEFGVVGYPDIPELSSEDDQFRSRADIRPYVETIPGPSTEFFGKLAKELGIWIQFGTVEVDRVTDKYYNAAVTMDSKGAVAAKYRKINLYHQETDFLSPGESITTYDGPFGKVGMIICADVYGQRPMNDYGRAGVQVFALSTSWAEMNTGMDMFTSAARRYHAYLLAANQPYFPDSGVINPDGRTQSHIRQTTGVAYGYLPRRATRR